MANPKTAAAEDDETEGEGAALPPPRKKLSGKKLVLFGVVPLLVIGLLVGGAFYFGLLDGILGRHHAKEAEKLPEKPAIFYDLPEMLVNLHVTGKQVNYLKLRVSLEVDSPEAVKRLEQLMPRVVDNFQVFLRELRIDELTGSSGLYRLKEELLLRVNLAVQPTKVKDVLFKDMLVQ